MKRIYSNRASLWRLNISAAVVVIAFLFGFWELWNVTQAGKAGEAGTGYGLIFAALFIGGGIYAMRQMLVDNADTVVAIEADEAGRSVIRVWRPFVSKRIAGPLDRLTNWRFDTKTERNITTPMLLADHPDRPKPLQLELGKRIAVSDELRALAPDAVAAFERAER